MKTGWSDTYTLDGPGKGSDYEPLMLHLDLRVARLQSINFPARSEGRLSCVGTLDRSELNQVTRD